MTCFQKIRKGAAYTRALNFLPPSRCCALWLNLETQVNYSHQLVLHSAVLVWKQRFCFLFYLLSAKIVICSNRQLAKICYKSCSKTCLPHLRHYSGQISRQPTQQSHLNFGSRKHLFKLSRDSIQLFLRPQCVFRCVLICAFTGLKNESVFVYR